MDREPLVSIIILNYNSSKFIKKCLVSVFKTDYDNYEVILVDNGSHDNSADLADKFFGSSNRIRIIRNNKNLGFSGGNNQGSLVAKGEYLVFLNIDTQVERDWLRSLVNTINIDSSIGAAQCKLRKAGDKKKLESVGHYIDYTGIESYESSCVNGELDVGQYDMVKEIFYAKGAAFIVRRGVFFEVGMFDPTYFMDHDEIDLCWRIRLRGYRIVFVPSAVVYHYGAGSVGLREENTFILFHLRKNHMTSLIKNYELINVVKYLPRYIIYLAFHGLYSIHKGRADIVIAYIKSFFWIIKNLKSIQAERSKVQKLVRRVPDSTVMCYMTKAIIPWHFLHLNSFKHTTKSQRVK